MVGDGGGAGRLRRRRAECRRARLAGPAPGHGQCSPAHRRPAPGRGSPTLVGPDRPGRRVAGRRSAPGPGSQRHGLRAGPRPRGRTDRLGVLLGVRRARAAVGRFRAAGVAADRPRPAPAATAPVGGASGGRRVVLDRDRDDEPQAPRPRPVRRPARAGAGVRRVDRHVQRDLPGPGRGRRAADQRCRRRGDRACGIPGRTRRRRHDRPGAGGACGGTAAAPFCLHRHGPAGPLRRATGLDHRRHGSAGRVLPGWHRPLAHGPARRGPGLDPRERRDRAGLPAGAGRHREPAPAGPGDRPAGDGAVPLRGRRQRVPDRTARQLLRGQRRLCRRPHRKRRGRDVPGRHRRAGRHARRDGPAGPAGHLGDGDRRRRHPLPRRVEPDVRRPRRTDPRRARLRARPGRLRRWAGVVPRPDRTAPQLRDHRPARRDVAAVARAGQGRGARARGRRPAHRWAGRPGARAGPGRGADRCVRSSAGRGHGAVDLSRRHRRHRPSSRSAPPRRRPHAGGAGSAVELLREVV